jgi:KaiC/GvpD/RAD55 family RecA-like ATPase
MDSQRESPTEPLKDSFEHFKTGIDTLDDVLDGGIRCLPGKGMLGVIAGAAGAGKSILALQMCCSFLLNRRQTSPTKPYGAVYITHEDPESIEAQVEDFTYFRSKSDDDGSPPISIEKDRLHSLLEPLEGKPTLHICRVPLDKEQQGRVLQNIFDTISQRIGNLADSEKDPLGNVLVCLDNIRTIQNEALLAAMSGLVDNSPRGHQTDSQKNGNFYKELHQYCVKRKLHTFLVMEEDIPEGVDPERYEISYRPEVFAADIVIRLGIRTYSTEYRERFIQIVKAKHQFYYRGKHHFSIVSKDGGGRKKEERHGLVVYPSIPMQLSLLQNSKSRQGSGPGEGATSEAQRKGGVFDRLTLGIDSLDGKIADAVPLKLEGGKGYIRPCTNSVLVCDLDAMATIIGLHFAIGGGVAPAATSDSRGIFISFKHKREDIKGIAERFFPDNLDEKLTVYDFPPEYISGHKLLRDITELITEKQDNKPGPLRVVLDDVFELQCKYPLITDTRGFLASLFEVFSGKGLTSLVVDTVEVGEGRNPIESSFAAGLADSVFLLRHVEFHSQPHRVFSVLKLVDLHTPDNLWDLKEVRPSDGDRYKLLAEDTFALYKNVLTGRPEPITITFSLYNDEENSPFHAYLQGQIESLRHSFGESLHVNLFGADDYSRVQNLLAAAETLPRGDCHIVALDEFWLRQLIQRKRLEDLTEPIRKLPAEEKLVAEKGDYVCAAHDIALHQLQLPYDRWYAIPARNNCGILCFDKGTVRSRFEQTKGWSAMEAWMGNPEAKTITWDSLIALKEGRGKDGRPQTFFTFCMDQIESCVSFLLELALAYEAGDKFEWRFLKE